jgi:hypothetical protein
VHFYQQGFITFGNCHQRNTAIDYSLVGVHFVAPEFQFVCMRNSGGQCSDENISDFCVFVHVGKHCLADCTRRTYAKQILGGRVKFDNQEVVIKDDDSGGKAVEDVCREPGVAMAPCSCCCYLPIAFCCT